jgi:hypothetical protein
MCVCSTFQNPVQFLQPFNSPDGLCAFIFLGSRRRRRHPSRCSAEKEKVSIAPFIDGLEAFSYLLQVRQAGIQKLLLLRSNLSDFVDLLNTVGAQLDLGGKEVNALVLVQWAVDESRLNNTLLSLSGLQQRLSEAGTSHSHRQSSRSSTILSLDDLITTELHTVEERRITDEIRVRGLREQRNDCDARVSTNNDDVLINGVGVLDLRDEAGCADNIEGGDTEQALGVVDTCLLEDLGDDGHGGVDGVGDDEDVRVWGRLGGGFCEIADNRGVGVEEVVAGHAWLSGDTGGDKNDFGTLQGSCQSAGCWVISGNLTLGVDV